MKTRFFFLGLIVTTFLCFGTAIKLVAQTNPEIKWRGLVLDEGQNPMSGVSITLVSQNGANKQNALTDKSGHFQFSLSANTKWRLTLQYVGYEELVQNIKINEKTDKLATYYLAPKSTILEPLEVRAIRAGDHAPFAKTNITAGDIKENNTGRDLPYLLDQTPNVVVNSDAGNGIGYTGIHIRGSDATRTNITINGIPYNDAESSGSYFVDVPDIASSVGSIQIQRGVGTSSNGAGAFGATINLSTNEVHKLPYASLSSSGGSYNSWKNTIQAGTGLMDGKFTTDVRLSRISSDGFIQRAASNLQSLMVSTAYIGQKTTVRFNFITGKEKTYQAWNGVSEDVIDKDRTYNELGEKSDGTFYKNQTDNYNQTHYQLFLSHQFNESWSVNLTSFLTRGLGYYEEYKTDAGYSDYGLSNPDTASTDLIRRQYLDNYFYGETFSVQYKKTNDLFTLGGSWTNYDGGHYGNIIWAQNGGVADNYKYYDNPAFKYDKSVYLKWMHDFAGYWHFFADVQYRNVWHKMDGFKDAPEQRIKRNFDFFNPKIGISYANNGYNAYLSYAMANKEPNRDDFESRIQEPPKREQLQDIELGIEKKSTKYNWSANLYYMQYKDQLVLTGALNDVGSPTRINVPNSYRTGLELQGGYNFANWINATANISFSRNKVKNFDAYFLNFDEDYNPLEPIMEKHRNTDIAFSPNVVGSATINLIPLRDLTISLVSKYVGGQYLDNTQNEARNLKAYYNQDMRIKYQLKNKFFKQVQLIGQVYNILNRLYNTNGATYPEYDNGELQNYIYYFPAAGTHFMVGINLDL